MRASAKKSKPGHKRTHKSVRRYQRRARNYNPDEELMVKARVPVELKEAVVAYANSTRECESVIVREAVTEYLAVRGVDSGKRQLGSSAPPSR